MKTKSFFSSTILFNRVIVAISAILCKENEQNNFEMLEELSKTSSYHNCKSCSVSIPDIDQVIS